MISWHAAWLQAICFGEWWHQKPTKLATKKICLDSEVLAHMYDDIDIRMLMVEIEIPVELGRFLPLFIRVLYIQTVGFVSLGFSDSNPFGVEQKGPVATAGCRPMFWWTSKRILFDRGWCWWISGSVEIRKSEEIGCWRIFWVVVSFFFNFQPYLGKIPILTNIFPNGLKPPTSWMLKDFVFFGN